jgi:two-component system, sensor histidine kinase and response regulator
MDDNLRRPRPCPEELLDDRYLLDTLMEQAPDQIYFKDDKSRFVRISRGLADRLGLGAPADAIGKTDFDFFSGEHADAAFADEQRLLQTGESLVGIEERETWAGGREAWVSTTKVPLSDRNGQIIGLFGISRDITERKRGAERLAAQAERVARQNDQLRELDLMKDDFVALVSHELRTPLTVIQGYNELLLDGTVGELNDEQRTMLATIERNGVRLLRLVNDLLFVAQLNGGKLTMAIEDVDLAAIVGDAIADAGPRAEAAEVTLALCCDATPIVRADGIRLAQVFDNLISNAIKFTPAGGRVGLSVSMLGEDATIVVADSGMGMTPEDQQRLFTRFFRTTAAANIQGTGLGLSITKAIVDAHNGSISVTSEPGHGTSVTVTIPNAEPLVGEQQSRRLGAAVASG